MSVYELKSVFGWAGDQGLGDRLIQQIIDGEKYATCSFKILYSETDLLELFDTKGEIVTVVNSDGVPKCNIRIIDVFETAFGSPDMRLVKGEGDGENVRKFQKDHQYVWESTVLDTTLTSDTILIAELFEFIEIL